ncbi:MAG: ABC transporter ATP-binding protein [FCB group bacterium]|jgi:ABC-2 type transport system ATP-binding protein|nr:ABC transporter ATP-binding protein [FCB group bacterium]
MIEVRSLTKYYGSIAAVNDLSFHVEKGEIVGFLGPNGAGKTTTMRMLTGFSPASKGTARIAGYDVREQPLEVKRRVGYLPENIPLYPEMRVRKFLQYVAEVKGLSGGDRVREVDRVAERCGLRDVAGRTVGNLSKGYRQRVGLAQALIGSPPVLILDEPTVGLDPRQIIEIRQMIQDLAREHTVLLSTHILPEVSMICRRVIIINRGRIVTEDTMERLSGGDARVFVVEADGAPARVESLLKSVKGIGTVTAEGNGRFAVTSKDRGVREAIARAVVEAGMGLRALETRSRTLEEVFVEAISADGGRES